MRCSHRGATQYHLFNVHYQLRCESLSIFSCSIVHGRLYVRFSVLTNFNWNKRGQTSSPVHVAEIQRNSNRKENVCSPYNLLGSVLFSLCNVSGRSPNNILVWSHSNNICLVTAILSYTKIFFAIRRHQIDVKQRTQQQQTNQTILNIARYRKAVYTALWVQAVLVVCYLPYSIVIALFSHESISSSYFVSWTVTVSLVYLNSSLNPFLYCWRISEIRQVVKGTIRQAFNCIWN